MIREFIATLFVCFGLSVSFGQVQELSKEDFINSNFESLTTLKSDLKDVSIVGLGESSHFMGETYRAKVKMVKYLHEECGFDVLAIESPLYDAKEYYNDSINQGKVTGDDFLRSGAISGVWLSDDMLELFNYIVETQKTDRPLIYAGFDNSFFYQDSHIDKDFTKFITKLNEATISEITTDSIFISSLNHAVRKSYSIKTLPVSDTLVLYSKFEEIKKSLDKLEVKDKYFKYWEQILLNLESRYRMNYKLYDRDYMMAKNVDYLVNNEYPNKKMILWAATVHLLADKNSTQGTKKRDKQFMGYFLKQKYKEKYYHIAFVPGSGVTGLKGYLGIGKKRAVATKGSIERYIKESIKEEYAFMSTRTDLSKEIVNNHKINKSLLIGLTPYKTDISTVVDGFFYMRQEYLPEFKERKRVWTEFNESNSIPL